MRRFLSAIVVAITLGYFPAGANAILINTLNAPVAFTISKDVGGGLVLNATGTVTVTSGFNSSAIILHVVLNNSSILNGAPLTPADNVRLTGWGFGIDPNATGVMFIDAIDGGMIDASLDSIPGLNAIEICAWGGNNCSGGSNGGIDAGNSDVFDLRLAGLWGNTITIDPLGVKFQTGSGSYEFSCTGACTGGPGPSGGPLPEPRSLALVALGLIALAVIGRRRPTR